MMRNVAFFFILSSLFSIFGCKSGPCLRNDIPTAETKTSTAQPAPAAPSYSRVKVAKPDGSLQCGKGKQISLTEMSKQLAGIQIYSEENLNDGLMRIQVCGAPTGQFNVYEIPQEDLKKATGLGFKQWAK